MLLSASRRECLVNCSGLWALALDAGGLCVVDFPVEVVDLFYRLADVEKPLVWTTNSDCTLRVWNVWINEEVAVQSTGIVLLRGEGEGWLGCCF